MTEPIEFQPREPGARRLARDARKTNSFAVASFCFGIASLFVSWFTFHITSILAIVYGHKAMRRVKQGTGEGEGYAIAGLVLGYFCIALTVIVVAAMTATDSW